MKVNFTPEQGKACLEIENAELRKENQKLKKEVAKLHIIQEEYGNHIENTHIIDDYQKTYFMSNKYLIELKNGKFVYIDEIEKENQRLNNVLNALEESYIEDIEKLESFGIERKVEIAEIISCYKFYLRRLRELKESDK